MSGTGVNGLTFEHRSWRSLAERMQQFVDDPALARRLGRRGYLYSENGDVPAIEDHVRAVERIYERVLERRDSARVKKQPGPWRILSTPIPTPATCAA